VPTEYVRLTFLPAGAKRKRTVWAERAGKQRFWVVNQEGDRDRHRSDHKEELVILAANEYTIRPAVMSKKYAMLFLVDDPELNNEVDCQQEKVLTGSKVPL
jgi:hypothetical protein